MWFLLKRFLADERGDLIQNLGWLAGVSLGSIVVGGLVYNGIRSYGTNVQNQVKTMTVTPPTPTYGTPASNP